MKTLIKIMSLILALAAISAIAAPALAVNNTMYVGVTPDVNFRTAPNGSLICRIPYGDTVTYISNSTVNGEAWIKCTYGSKTGYIMSKFLQTENPTQGNIWLDRYGAAIYKSGSNARLFKNIQHDLNQYFRYVKNVTNYSWFPLSVDGICGDKSVSAIKEFQKLEGLTVDGIVGDNTKDRLMSRTWDYHDVTY